MRVSHYPALNKDLWALISRPTQEDMSLVFTPRKYTRPVSQVMSRIISEQVKAIEDRQVMEAKQALVSKVRATYAAAVKNPEEWVEAMRAVLAGALAEDVVRPLIAHLDGPLKQQAYSVMDSLYAAEVDMVRCISSDLDSALPSVLAVVLARQSFTELLEAVENFLDPGEVRTRLEDFFKSFVASDAYLEFRDIETYVATNDSLQLYLYIGGLRFRNNTYPLFFLPIETKSLEKDVGYELKIVNHLFANRRAIDYVLQEMAAGQQREWVSPVKERINYIAPQQSIFEVARGFFSRVANAVDLPGQVELSSGAADASNTQVTLSPAMFICAHEKSDEALLNDYEELIEHIRKGGSAVAALFEGIVRGMIVENPISIAAAVEEEWSQLPMVDRMVFDSPIPLNEEQRKILLAVSKPEGKIVVVEGPPGTGKSHTITAIAADCALNKRSCLVLSDKTEALDVVQSKLSEAMNRVRNDRDFPNPILRIGQQNANFRKLTTKQVYGQVASFVRATQANSHNISEELRQVSASLKEDIAATIRHLGSVSMTDLAEMHECEAELQAAQPEVAAAIRHQKADLGIANGLKAIEEKLTDLQEYLAKVFSEGDYSPESLWQRVRRDTATLKFMSEFGPTHLALFDSLTQEQLRQLTTILVCYRQLDMPLLGYLFRGVQVRQLEAQLNALSVTRPLLLKNDAAQLEVLVKQANDLRMRLEAEGLGEALPQVYTQVARNAKPASGAEVAMSTVALFRRIDTTILDALLGRNRDDAHVWPLTVRFLRRWVDTRKAFDQAPAFDYIGTKSRLEQLNTSAMNSHVDSRLIHFMDNHRTDALTLASVITNRQKFPEDKFSQIRESFPVIIASIREFGEFMPLLPELFDVVIIDEASQVSVAQALPALLRAKKVVVLGDTKQFSNVKSSNASNQLNDKYRTDLVRYFEANVSSQADALDRLKKFDVKKSILDFCNHGASYSTMLRKHFRSYPELISYSSRTFYAGQLQAIKIRCAPLDEVIRFDQVEAGDKRVTRGTNEAEAEFIMERLLEIVDEAEPPTVGIITPFREQQTMISKKLFGHARARDFEDKLRLKVMTFDSCQGEERNIIFYSMVATPGNDALNYVFPVSLSNPEDSVEEKLKVQRLNVGFSRAQEMIWVAHSMPLSDYKGAIGQALNHYKGILGRQAATADKTDPSSPMEAKLLDWLQQTAFVQTNMDTIEIIPQFPLGNYLRQLDPLYQHPSWRVDFLLTYQTEKMPVRIVIEYDGFEHHFQKGRTVHVGNYQRYMTEADVERQLTLESYGYRFLRVNRFNLGKDPVVTLNERLMRLVEVATGEPVSEAIDKLKRQADGLQNKDMKVCARCGQIHPLRSFYDENLKGGAGGYGRVCLSCKSTKVWVPSRRRWR